MMISFVFALTRSLSLCVCMGACGCIFDDDDDDDDACNYGEAEAKGRGLRSIEFVIISFDRRCAGCLPRKICHDEETFGTAFVTSGSFSPLGVISSGR